ncbi:MAG: sulfotransferase [Opitutaceae bacterium]
MSESPVVIVTGIEHSGTTLLAELLLQHPGLAGGFEGGLLLASEPARFPEIDPWYEWMMDSVEAGYWGIPESLIHRVCQADNWRAAYEAIRETSPLFRGRTSRLLDKTPAYQACLPRVMARAPAGTPCLVIEKTPVDLWRSFRKRTTFADFEERRRHYHQSWREAQETCGNQLLRIRYETLCQDLEGELERAFRFIGLESPAAFARMADSVRDRFEHDRALPLPQEELDRVKRLADELRIDSGFSRQA